MISEDNESSPRLTLSSPAPPSVSVFPSTPPPSPCRNSESSVPCTPGKSPAKRSRTAFTEKLIRANQQRIESKFEGCTTKEQVTKRIIRYKNDLLYVPLTLPSVSSAQLSKDFQRERVLLNDVAFIPDKNDTYRNTSFVATLHMLISRLVAREGIHCVTPVRGVHSSSSSTGVVIPHEHGHVHGISQPPSVPTIDSITNIILQRASRTGCGSDSFFMVQKLFAIEGTFVTQKVETTDEPIKMRVFIDRKVAPLSEDSSEDGSGAHGGGRGGSSTDGSRYSSRAEEFHQQYVYNASQVASSHIRSPSGGNGTKIISNIASTLEKLTLPPRHMMLTKAASASHITGSSSEANTPVKPHGTGRQQVRSARFPANLASLSRGLSLGFGGATAGRPKSSSRFTPTQAAGAQPAAVNLDSVPTIAGVKDHTETRTGTEKTIDTTVTTGTGTRISPPLPPEEDLSGGLCCIVTVANNFNIADVSSIENVTEDCAPDVWLTVSTVVTDESNFKTGRFSRHVAMTVSTPYGNGSRTIERTATIKQELLDTRHKLRSILHTRPASRASECADDGYNSQGSSSEDE